MLQSPTLVRWRMAEGRGCCSRRWSCCYCFCGLFFRREKVIFPSHKTGSKTMGHASVKP